MKTIQVLTALALSAGLTACAEPGGQTGAPKTTYKSDSELIYENCFLDAGGFIDRYNTRGQFKAIVGGVKGQVGQRRMRCFSTANSSSRQRARDRSFEQCRDAGYQKCFLAAEGTAKSDWVIDVEQKRGRVVTLR